MSNEEEKKELIIKTIIKKEKEKNIYSDLSQYTTKIEEEGMLEMNEVKDLIIYYKLDEESGKDYLLKKNDYTNFIRNKMKKYLDFYLS